MENAREETPMEICNEVNIPMKSISEFLKNMLIDIKESEHEKWKENIDQLLKEYSMVKNISLDDTKITEQEEKKNKTTNMKSKKQLEDDETVIKDIFNKMDRERIQGKY